MNHERSAARLRALLTDAQRRRFETVVQHTRTWEPSEQVALAVAMLTGPRAELAAVTRLKGRAA